MVREISSKLGCSPAYLEILPRLFSMLFTIFSNLFTFPSVAGRAQATGNEKISSIAVFYHDNVTLFPRAFHVFCKYAPSCSFLRYLDRVVKGKEGNVSSHIDYSAQFFSDGWRRYPSFLRGIIFPRSVMKCLKKALDPCNRLLYSDPDEPAEPLFLTNLFFDES